MLPLLDLLVLFRWCRRRWPQVLVLLLLLLQLMLLLLQLLH